MTQLRETAKLLTDRLSGAGIEKYALSLSRSEKQELNTELEKFSLYRTTFDQDVKVTVFTDGKKGDASGNDLSEEGLEKLVDTAIAAAQSSPEDEAFDIAPCQGKEVFTEGPQEGEIERLYDRIQEVLDSCAQQFPKILMMQIIGSYTRSDGLYLNSNGTDFETHTGVYETILEFAGNEGEKTTGINDGYAAMKDLDIPVLDHGMIRRTLEDTQKSLDVLSIGDKFEGTVVFTPSCLGYMIYMLGRSFLGDSVIMEGSSPWRSRIGEKVASEAVTVRLAAQDDRLAVTEPFTADGFQSENVTVLEKGVLRCHLLSLYAANKTGGSVTKNDSMALIMEPGEKSLDQIISGVKRGLLVGGFSGGHPGANGEISGVAKNSFYIEDGKIKGAVMETMINGNLADIFANVSAVSSELVCDGTSVLPYMATEGMVISG